MKLPKGLGFMIISVVVALVATLFIHRYIVLKTKPKPQARQCPIGQLLIANTDIAAGTPISGRLVREVTWPKDIIPPRAICSLSQVDGRVVKIPICKGEPMLINKLAPEGTAAGLGGILKTDRLALTVRTNDVSGVAGFIHPGDRVDVLVTLPVPEGQHEQFSKIILQNILVLSTGQFWGQTLAEDQDSEGCRPKAKEPRVQTTATLEVTPAQAEVLNLGSTQGKIRLALRNNLNTAEGKTPGVLTSSIIKGNPMSRDKHRVEVIKGLNRSAVNL